MKQRHRWVYYMKKPIGKNFVLPSLSRYICMEVYGFYCILSKLQMNQLKCFRLGLKFCISSMCTVLFHRFSACVKYLYV
jgi:hypothetical protein